MQLNGAEPVPAQGPAQVEAEAPAETAVTFQFTSDKVLSLCSSPILHGLDANGEKLWSKSFESGGVPCTAEETAKLRRLRLEHPHLGLRYAVQFTHPPTGTVRLEPEFFGDCLVQLNGRPESDLGAHLVIAKIETQSFADAAFNGRAEVIANFDELRFVRLPIGRYSVGLFRDVPRSAPLVPYHYGTVSIRPCEESIVDLAAAGR